MEKDWTILFNNASPKAELDNKENEKKKNKPVEMPGIEPGASYMQSMRSTTELHPLAKVSCEVGSLSF